MKINYEEIITKANERKDALQAVAKDLPEIGYHKTRLYQALEYFVALKNKVEKLDAEGKQILGQELALRIQQVGLDCNMAYNKFENEPTKDQMYYNSIRAVERLAGALDD